MKITRMTMNGDSRSASRFAALVVLACCFVLRSEQSVQAQQWTTNGSDINNSNGGNVGIGTTAPVAKLHIHDLTAPGQPPFFIRRDYDGTRVRLSYAGTDTYGEIGMVTGPGSFTPNDSDLWMGVNLNSTGASHVTAPTQSNASASSWITRWNSRAGDHFSIQRIAPGGGSNASTFLHINGSGNVGIGTTGPSVMLDVQKSGSGFTELIRTAHPSFPNGRVAVGHDSGEGELQIFDSANASRIRLSAFSGLANYINNGGNVGIGTPSPSERLDVQGGRFRVGNTQIFDNEINRYGSDNLYIQYRNAATGATAAAGNTILNVNGGNVGIGTGSPSERLHVAGNVVVTGNISAKYQDIAEWVAATQPILPGTVVVVDPNRPNSVVPSFEPYDTRVAGVISSNPGIVLGEADEGKIKVATTGRVKVRVDATRAPIRLGDLLVTSDKQGVAMRSEPVDLAGVKIHRPGTLIGKALEILEHGEGEIMVLLSLQ